MSFNRWWTRLALTNGALADEASKITLTVGQLKNNMEKAYSQGAADQKQLHEDIERLRPKSPFDGLFKF